LHFKNPASGQSISHYYHFSFSTWYDFLIKVTLLGA
jgi:hypothetical protein